MKKSIAKKWVKALRSGEYNQGNGHLVNVNPDGSERFCCLGVLCNLATESGYGEWSGLLFVDEKGNDHYGYLPEGVKEWAGLKSIDGARGHALKSLATLNDHGATFAEIANIVEAEYETL